MAANSYRNVFLTNIGTLPQAGTVTTGLAVGQIGVFNTRTNTAVTTPNFPAVRSIQIVQGTPDKNLPAGVLYGDQSWRTPEILPDSSVTFTALKAQKPQNMIVALGFDGVDTSKTMAPAAGKPVRVYLTLYGQPVDNLLGGTGNHPAALTETFDLDLPCVSDCTDTCGSTVDCNAVADNLLKLFGERKLPGGQLLSKYVKATKLTQCTAPSGIVTTTCTKYTLTIPDTGDQRALGIVEAQYPGVSITRLSYDAPYSVYQAIVCPSGLPAAFQADSSPIIPNCAACPSGYSYSAQSWIYTVTSTSSLATIKTNYSDTSAFLLSSDGVTFVYEIHKSTSAVPSASGTDKVLFVGVLQDVCTLSGPGVTTVWSSTGVGTGTCDVAYQTYSLSLSDTSCGSNRLADLQAVYGSGVSVVASGICSHQYELVVASAPSCVDCGEDQFVFTQPQPFGTSVWTLVPPAQQGGEGTGCVCGVKFESAYVARDRQECWFEDVSYEVEPLFLYVSSNNPDFRDYSTLCDDLETFPVTLLQTAKYAQGFGSFVADQVKQSRFYFNDPWYNQPVVRDAFGYQLGVDLQGYYDSYILEFKAPKEGATDVSGFGLSQYEFYEWTIYIPAGQGGAFQNAINSWIVSFGGQPAVI